MLKETGEPILDFGCGVGHASFVFSHFSRSSNIFCVDANFLNLTLAKKYFIRAQFVCIDTTSTLPFNDGSFSFIFCNDAFHFFNSKLETAKEFQRILKNEGAIVISHIHNALACNMSAGTPLSSSSYSRLFANMKTVTFPEDDLLRSFIYENIVNMGKTFPQKELDSSNAVTLVASHNEKLFKEYGDVKRYLLSMKESLILNPIYDVTEKGKQYLLKRAVPRFRGFPDLMKEYYLTDKILPKTLDIEKNIMEAILTKRYKNCEHEINKLIESFVLINVPKRY